MKRNYTKKIAACLMAALCAASIGTNSVSAGQLGQDSQVAALDAAKSANEQVLLYEHAKFMGVSVALGYGRYTSDQFSALAGKVSAVKVPDGFIVTLYENSDFTGSKRVLDQDVSFLNDFNDLTSSVVISEDKVTLYKDAYYSGPSVKLGVGSYTFSDFGNIGDDAISSLRVPEGLKVTLYSNSDFTGTEKVLTSDNEWLDVDGYNDLTSSLVIELDQ